MKSRRHHILTIFGTRPEAIKLGPVIRELLRRHELFKVTVCATAQHRQLLDQVTSLFRIPIHYDLNIMKRGQSLQDLTSRVLVGVSEVLHRTRPALILVQGDTTTVFAASLAAFYERIPVAHVEAGLRTHDRFSPFPEEINRRLTTHLADYHFAPTNWARDNLLREGIVPDRIFVTGNTAVDAFVEALDLVRRQPPALNGLKGLDLCQRKLLLVTAHRRENFGQNLADICAALRQIVLERKDVEIVYSVHPNPNVRGPVRRALGGIGRVHLVEPLAYLPFVWLMSKAYFVLTDSGGIQEEMPSLGRPVLVMRDKTERPEGVQAGVCQLVGTKPDSIYKASVRLLEDESAYRRFSFQDNPFGDGKAAVRIVRHLSHLAKGEAL